MIARDFVVGDPNNYSFQAAQPFCRLRRKTVPDPYDPEHVVAGGWQDAEKTEILGVMASRTSVEQPDATRSEVVSTAQFVSADPDADIRRGDRIRDRDGRTWTVSGYPTRDRNPFTGWRPTVVANLEEVIG
jgi:hypothetical protein